MDIIEWKHQPTTICFPNQYDLSLWDTVANQCAQQQSKEHILIPKFGIRKNLDANSSIKFSSSIMFSITIFNEGTRKLEEAYF